MTVSLKHTTQSTKPASARSNDIDGPIWNEEHTLTAGTEKLLGTTALSTTVAEITIGSGLTLTGSTLSASGGSGDMAAATYDPASISEQLVGLTATQTLTNKTITSAAFSGAQTGTLTTSGVFTVNNGTYAGVVLQTNAGSTAEIQLKTGTSIRWSISKFNTAETGSDAGSDFGINNWSDAGAFLGTPLFIERATGATTLNGATTINSTLTTTGDITIDSAGDSALYMDANASGNQGLVFFQTNGSNRWVFFKTPAAESGSNVGSDFAVSRYSDAGGYLDDGFRIARNTGYIDIPGAYAETTASAANVFVATNGSLQRSTSSLRYKVDVENMTYGLKDVLALRPVTYTPKPNGDNEGEVGTRYGGLIAEEVHAAGLTEFVGYNEAGEPDSLHYGHMVALAMKAIQEQQTIINDLKAEIEQLKEQING